MNEYIWYAVEMNEEDNDWGTGSFRKFDAMKMARNYGYSAQIAVISGWAESLEDAEENGLQNTECIEVIPYEDMALTLKELRESTGMTQAETAKKAKINPRTYQFYEQGAKTLQLASGTTIHSIAKALDVTMEDVMELESERTMYCVVDEWGGDMFTTWYTAKERDEAVKDAENQWSNIQRDEDFPENHHVYVGKKHSLFVNPFGTWELSDSVQDFDMDDIIWDSEK